MAREAIDDGVRSSPRGAAGNAVSSQQAERPTAIFCSLAPF